MKCLSLWQPWASGIAWHLKHIETRSWRCPAALIGQRIAIHAAKRKVNWLECQHLIPAFGEVIAEARGRDGYIVGDVLAILKMLPLGCIVATATVQACQRTEDIGEGLSQLELLFGNYEPGRWGWVLTDVQEFENPIPYRGAQGLFEVPDEVIRDVQLVGVGL